MSNVYVMDHPLIQHKIGFIRRQEVGSKDFRAIVSEIAMLMCFEATRDLKLQDVEDYHAYMSYRGERTGRKEAGDHTDPSGRPGNGGRDASAHTCGKGGPYRIIQRSGDIEPGGILLQTPGRLR